MNTEQRKQLIFEQRERIDILTLNLNQAKEEIHQMMKDERKINTLFSEDNIFFLQAAIDALNDTTDLLKTYK